METAYGIGVKNRYAVFIGEEEEDPLEILTKKEEEKSRTNTKAKALNDSKHSNTNSTGLSNRDFNSSIKEQTSISFDF